MADNKGHGRRLFYEAVVNHPLILYIFPEEAYRLTTKAATDDASKLANLFYSGFYDFYEREHGEIKKPYSISDFALGCVFLAGRIQGIREERGRRRKGKITDEKRRSEQFYPPYRKR